MQKQKGMMVGLFVSDTSVADGNLCFTCAADPVSEGKVYAKALQDLGYHRLAILGVKQQGAQLAHDGVVSALGTGVSMVADENFIFGERDFRTLWIKIREKNPDVVMINAFEPEFGIAMRHKAQMGVDAPLATIEWLSSCKLTPEFEGAWEVGPGPCLYTNGFAEKIKEFDPKVNDAVIAAYAYDMLNVIVSAYETAAKPGAGKPSRQSVAAELHNHEFEGELGTIHVDSRGVMDFPAGFWIVEGGQRVPVSFDELKAKLGR
jgi:ABC-type branched-subunit amino acid transport system substrate-binding protein